ncbi:hypothetical protein C8Q80DRAFT_1264626 [Daedaleopsis nitida]|nr:hypothetical protein C8Q80DRAFT_1264626 [Daedaleopsis nitida]
MSGVDVVTLPTAEFISFFLETLSFGIFAVLYGITIWVLAYRIRRRTSRLLLVTSTLMLLIALVHLGIDVQRAREGFVLRGGLTDGETKFFSNTNATSYVVKSVLYVTQTLLGDAFMAYRVFVLWEKSWRVAVVPLVLLTSAAFVGYGACYNLTTIPIPSQGFSNIMSTSPWLDAFLAIVTAYNLLTGALVVIRFYRSKLRTRRSTAVASVGKEWQALESFIQSAAIYSVVLMSLFVTYIIGANPEMFGIDILTPLVGIAFDLIIIRVGLLEAAAEKLKPRANAPRTGKNSSTARAVEGSQEGKQAFPGVRKLPPIKTSPFIRFATQSRSGNADDIESGRVLLQAVENAISSSPVYSVDFFGRNLPQTSQDNRT